MLMACVALMALVVVSAEAQNGATPAKNAVTNVTIINSCGGRLAKMFAQFGAPSDVVPIRGNMPDEDDGLCDYDSYVFRVHVWHTSRDVYPPWRPRAA
jgi:hypothetical protein